MTHNAELVRLECPLCEWRSGAVGVEDWQARCAIADDFDYHIHRKHRPKPSLVTVPRDGVES